MLPLSRQPNRQPDTYRIELVTVRGEKHPVWRATPGYTDADGDPTTTEWHPELEGYGAMPCQALAMLRAQIFAHTDDPAAYWRGFRSLRTRSRLSRRAAAERLGISAHRLKQVEHGEITKDPDDIVAWARELGITRSELAEETRRILFSGHVLEAPRHLR